MTVSTLNTKHIYDCNGVQTEWPYTFPFIASTDIAVYITDLAGTITKITSNFSVNEVDGFVKYPTAESELDPAVVVANGFKITLKRETPLTQEIDLVHEGALNAETLETGYDKATLQIQQQQEALSRCVKFPVDHTPTDDSTSSFLTAVTAAKVAAQAAQAAAESAKDAAVSADSSAQGHALTASSSAASAANSASSAAISAASIASRLLEGALSVRPDTLPAAGFFYATDIGQLYFYSPTSGWKEQ